MYHYVQVQSSAAQMNTGFDLWRAYAIKYGQPDAFRFKTASDIHNVIDAIPYGPKHWKTYQFGFDGPKPDNPPQWMLEKFELNVRDTLEIAEQQLANPEFRHLFDYRPYQEFLPTGERVYSNLGSGTWAWKQAVRLVCIILLSPSQRFSRLQDTIAKDPSLFGSMHVSIIAGSDKTTVSVATGHQEYHPVYMSIGNLHNTARRAHQGGIVPVAFLPIPKGGVFHRSSCWSFTYCKFIT